MGCDLVTQSDKQFHKQIELLEGALKSLAQTQGEFVQYFDEVESKEQSPFPLDALQGHLTSRLEALELLLLEMQSQRRSRASQQRSPEAAQSESDTERNSFSKQQKQGFSILNDPTVQALIRRNKQKLAGKGLNRDKC